MVLPFLVIAAVVGFVALLGVSALTVFVPALSNIIWVILLFGLAFVLSKTGVGNFEVYSGRNVKLNLTMIIILPALALLFLTLLGINLAPIFTSASHLAGSISLGSTTGGTTPITSLPADTLFTVFASFVGAVAGAWVLTQKQTQALLKKGGLI